MNRRRRIRRRQRRHRRRTRARRVDHQFSTGRIRRRVAQRIFRRHRNFIGGIRQRIAGWDRQTPRAIHRIDRQITAGRQVRLAVHDNLRHRAVRFIERALNRRRRIRRRQRRHRRRIVHRRQRQSRNSFRRFKLPITPLVIKRCFTIPIFIRCKKEGKRFILARLIRLPDHSQSCHGCIRVQHTIFGQRAQRKAGDFVVRIIV